MLSPRRAGAAGLLEPTVCLSCFRAHALHAHALRVARTCYCAHAQSVPMRDCFEKLARILRNSTSSVRYRRRARSEYRRVNCASPIRTTTPATTTSAMQFWPTARRPSTGSKMEGSIRTSPTTRTASLTSCRSYGTISESAFQTYQRPISRRTVTGISSRQSSHRTRHR